MFRERKKIFTSIQLLRVIACSLVLFSHIDPHIVSSLNRQFSGGGIGVDIFFIISGFVMAVATSKIDMGVASAFNFFIKRLIRIWPMYAIATIIFSFEMFYLYNEKIDFAYVVKSLSMFPLTTHNDIFGDIFIDPKLGVGWTLQFEIFFYLIIALLTIVKLRKPYFPAFIFAIPIFYNLSPTPLTPFWSMVSCPILFEFAFGYWIYSVYCRHPRAFQYSAPLLIPTGVTLTIFAMTGDWNQWFHNTPRMIVKLSDMNLHRVIAWGVPSAFLFCGVLGCEIWIKRSNIFSRFSMIFGDATYSLYLTHILVFQLLLRYLPVNEPYSKPIYIITPFGIALLIHAYIEKPLTERLSGIYHRFILNPVTEKLA